MQEPSPGYLGRHCTHILVVGELGEVPWPRVRFLVTMIRSTEQFRVGEEREKRPNNTSYMPQDAWEGGRVRDRGTVRWREREREMEIWKEGIRRGVGEEESVQLTWHKGSTYCTWIYVQSNTMAIRYDTIQYI